MIFGACFFSSVLAKERGGGSKKLWLAEEVRRVFGAFPSHLFPLFFSFYSGLLLLLLPKTLFCISLSVLTDDFKQI
jgi:hypothetical protein